MKYALGVLLVVHLITACNHPNKEIRERISVADSMAINYFKGDGSIDTVVAVSIISDKKKIALLATYIAAQPVEIKYQCGYDGSLHFFKMNEVIEDVRFRMNKEGCMYFSFPQYGKMQETLLPHEAAELIASFKKQAQAPF